MAEDEGTMVCLFVPLAIIMLVLDNMGSVHTVYNEALNKAW